MSSTSRGVTVPDEESEREAQGPWGGKTGGIGKYADVNGIKLYYETLGTGHPLILLHGGLGATSMFGANLPALAKGRQVIGVDLQGHGRTADIDRPLSPQLMAEDIAALIKHLNLDRPDVMGYSMGGGVAMFLAVRHPELVRKLVLVSTYLKRTSVYPELLAQQAQVGPEMAEAMKQTPMYQLYASIAPKVEDWPRLLGKIGDMMKEDFDYSKELSSIKVPTMIVAGDAEMFPPSHAVEMFELLGGGKRDGGWDGSGVSNARLAILPGVTHYAMGLAPALAPTVIRFLDEPAPNGQ
jgi:pimeloyl-ACP methyl ester carboxylesterase